MPLTKEEKAELTKKDCLFCAYNLGIDLHGYKRVYVCTQQWDTTDSWLELPMNTKPNLRCEFKNK